MGNKAPEAVIKGENVEDKPVGVVVDVEPVTQAPEPKVATRKTKVAA